MTAADRTEPERLLRWGLGHLPYEQLDPTDSFDELEGYSPAPADAVASQASSPAPNQAPGNQTPTWSAASDSNDQEVPF